MRRSSTVFPQPEGPKTTTHSPRSTCSDSPFALGPGGRRHVVVGHHRADLDALLLGHLDGQSQIYFTPQQLFPEFTTDWAAMLQQMYAKEIPRSTARSATAITGST